MFSALFRTGGVQLIIRKIKLVLFVEFFVSFHLGAFGSQSVSLAWDGSPDTNVIGYILYSGNASGDYGSRLDVGTNIVTTVSGLIEGNTYYFVITAYNAAGIESEQSNEVKFIVPGLVRMALGVNHKLQTWQSHFEAKTLMVVRKMDNEWKFIACMN